MEIINEPSELITLITRYHDKETIIFYFIIVKCYIIKWWKIFYFIKSTLPKFRIKDVCWKMERSRQISYLFLQLLSFKITEEKDKLKS